MGRRVEGYAAASVDRLDGRGFGGGGGLFGGVGEV